MEVTLVYSKAQVEAAAKFISENNLAFLGRIDYIRRHIQKSIYEMAEKFPNLLSIGTMGYTIIGSVEEMEGVDHDTNVMLIEVLVDPGLGEDWESEERVYNIPKTNED
jgi:hypothetical protein